MLWIVVACELLPNGMDGEEIGETTGPTPYEAMENMANVLAEWGAAGLQERETQSGEMLKPDAVDLTLSWREEPAGVFAKSDPSMALEAGRLQGMADTLESVAKGEAFSSGEKAISVDKTITEMRAMAERLLET